MLVSCLEPSRAQNPQPGIRAAQIVDAQKDQAKSDQPKKEVVDEKTLRELIKQLGDDSFDKREAADKRLAEIGEPALKFLQTAAAESTDIEVRQRAANLLQAIGKSLFVEVRKLAGHKKPGGNAPATRLVITPDGRQVLSIGIDALRSWDFDSGREKVVWERKGNQCFGLAISGDGKRVIIGCTGNQCNIWDLVTAKKISQPLFHDGPVWGAVLSADGKLAVSGSADKTIRVWDVDNGQQIRAFEGVVEEVRCLALSPDGKQVVAGHFGGDNKPGTVRLWDVATGKEIGIFEGHTLEISSVVFSPDGKTILSTSSDRMIRLWDIATGKELKAFAGHRGRVEYAAFTPDGKRIVSCGGLSNPTLR